MAITYNKVIVGTVATLIVTNASLLTTQLKASMDGVFLGDASVTVGTGLPLNDEMALSVNGALYGIINAATLAATDSVGVSVWYFVSS